MKYRDFWKYANPTPKQEEEPKKIGTWDYLTNYADDDLAFGFGHMLGNIADMTERATRPDGMTPQEWAGQQPDILKNFLTGTRTTSQNLQEGLDVPELEEGSLPYHLRNVVRSTPESVATMLVGSAIGGPIGAAVGGIGGKVAQKLAPALLSSNKARSTLFELQKLYQSNSFPAKVARALTPASGEMIGAMGLSSALEANSEYQGNINEYIADAKQNGTYVPGQTELEAEEKTKDSFLQNLGWISALNYPTFRVFYGGGKFTPGLLPMTKRIAGGGLAEAVEETGQEVINLLSLDKPPDETRLWDAAVAGGLMGTGFHAAGEIANYRSNKKQSQFEEALRKFGKEYSDNIGGITQGEDGSVRYSDDSIYGNFQKEVNDALGNNGNAEGNQDVYRGENGGAEGKYWVRNPNMNVSTEGMRPESLNALDMLGKYFYDNTGKPLILNAGTNGDNHAEGEFSHYNGWKFDIIDQLDGDGALITADYGRGPFLDQFIQYGRSLGLGMNFEGTGTNNVHLDVAVDGTQWDGNGDHAGGFNPQNARPSEPQGNSYDPNFTDRQNEVWQAAQYASQRLRDKHGIRLAPEVIYRQWALEDGGDFTHPSYNWGGLKDTAGNFRSFGSDREYADAYVDDFMALRPEINNVTDENGMVDDKSFTDVMLQTGYIVDSDYNNYINGLANISAPKTGYSGNSSSNATVPQWQQYLKEHQNKPSRIISNPAGGNPPKDDEPPKPLFDLDAEDSMTQNLLEKFLNERADQAIADNNVQEAEFIIGMFDDNSVFQNTQANREALAQRYGDALNTFFQNNLQEQTQPDSQQEEPETKGKSKKEKPYDRNATVIGKGREFLNELMKKADATSKENAWKLNSAIQNNDVAGVENILKQNNVAVPEPKQAQTQSSQDPVKENTSPENVLPQANKNTKGQEKLIKRASQNVTPKTSRNKKQNIGNAIIQLANQNGIAVSGVDFQSLRNGSSKKIKEWQAKLSEAGAFTVQPQQSNPAVGQSQTSESEQEEIDLGNGVTAFRPKGWQPPEPTLKERLNQFLAKARETERLNQEREKEADLANEDDESDTTPLIQSSLFDSDKADKRNQNEDDLLLRQEDEEGRAKQRQQEKENFDAAVKANSQRNFGALADKAKQAKDRYDATRVDPIHQQQQAVSEAQEDEEQKERLRREEDQSEDEQAKTQSPEQIRENYRQSQAKAQALENEASMTKADYDAHERKKSESEAQEDEEYKEDLRRREDQDEDAWAKDQSPEQIRKNYQLAQHLGDASTVERLQKLAEEGRKQRDQEKEQLKVADQQAKGNAGKDILRLLRAPEYSAAKARIESIPNLTTALVNGNIDAIRHARKILAETNPQIKSKPQTKPKPSNEKLASIANAPISQKSSERTTQGKALVRLAQESGIPLAPKLETALKNGYARAIEEAQNLIGEKNPKTSQEEFADSEESVNLIQSVAQKLKVKDRPALRYWVATQANNFLQAPNSESGQAAREALESLDVRDEYSEEELNRFENDDKVSKPFNEALRVVMGDSTQKISAPKLESPKLESSQPAAQSAQTQGQAQLQSQLQIQAQEQPKALPAPSEAQPQTQPQSQPQTQEQPQIQSQQQETSQPSVQTQTAPQAQEQSQPQVQEQQQEVAQPQAQEQEVTPEESRPQISPEEETANEPSKPPNTKTYYPNDYDTARVFRGKSNTPLPPKPPYNGTSIADAIDDITQAPAGTKITADSSFYTEPVHYSITERGGRKMIGEVGGRFRPVVLNRANVEKFIGNAHVLDVTYPESYEPSAPQKKTGKKSKPSNREALHAKLKTDTHPNLKRWVDLMSEKASKPEEKDIRKHLNHIATMDLNDQALDNAEENLKQALKQLDDFRNSILSNKNTNERQKQEALAAADFHLGAPSFNPNYPSEKRFDLEQKISQMSDKNLQAEAKKQAQYFDTRWDKEQAAVAAIEDLIRRDEVAKQNSQAESSEETTADAEPEQTTEAEAEQKSSPESKQTPKQEENSDAQEQAPQQAESNENKTPEPASKALDKTDPNNFIEKFEDVYLTDGKPYFGARIDPSLFPMKKLSPKAEETLNAIVERHGGRILGSNNLALGRVHFDTAEARDNFVRDVQDDGVLRMEHARQKSKAAAHEYEAKEKAKAEAEKAAKDKKIIDDAREEAYKILEVDKYPSMKGWLDYQVDKGVRSKNFTTAEDFAERLLSQVKSLKDSPQFARAVIASRIGDWFVEQGVDRIDGYSALGKRAREKHDQAAELFEQLVRGVKDGEKTLEEAYAEFDRFFSRGKKKASKKSSEETKTTSKPKETAKPEKSEPTQQEHTAEELEEFRKDEDLAADLTDKNLEVTDTLKDKFYKKFPNVKEALDVILDLANLKPTYSRDDLRAGARKSLADWIRFAALHKLEGKAISSDDMLVSATSRMLELWRTKNIYRKGKRVSQKNTNLNAKANEIIGARNSGEISAQEAYQQIGKLLYPQYFTDNSQDTTSKPDGEMKFSMKAAYDPNIDVTANIKDHETFQKVIRKIIVDNAVPDSKLTPQQKLLQSFGEKLGVKTIFFRNDNADFHGAHASNISYINVNSKMPLGKVFWHESMHWLKANNSKLYQQLVKAAGITDEQRQAYLEKTERTDLETDAEIDEEIIADQFEDVAKRNGLLQSIAGKNRGLVERVVQWLKDTMNKFIEFFHNPQGKLTTKQKQALADEFGKIATRLVDPNGERIFRHNRRTHNIELADGRNLSSIQADADTKYSFAINNGNYLQAVEEYQNAKTDEERQAALKKLQGMVQLAAEAKGFHNAVPEQTVAYKVRTTAAPKKTIKVYKVFTVANDGSPTALFVGGTEKLPQGVWLDAQDAWHFTAKNGNDYVPSTQNPFTKGGKTGGSVEIPNEATRQELIKRGFLPKGSKATKITALAYRPGWHAGTLPFFPQGGKKRAGSNYENIHRYNQVVFECELAADKNYTAEAEAQPKARNKDGSLNSRKADLQYMPKDGFYYYATNPLTHGNPKLGNWAISGSLKINRALTQEECDKILADHGKLPQEWEQGKLNLADLGYTGEQNDAARKTLAPITYDDNGNVIPLSQRFNAGKEDIRYSFAGKKAKIVYGGKKYPMAKRSENKKNASENGDGELVDDRSAPLSAATANGTTLRSHQKFGAKANDKGGVSQSFADVETNPPKGSIPQGESEIKYSLGRSNNSSESLTQKIRNAFSSWWKGSAKKNRNREITDLLYRVTGYKVDFGNVKDADKTIIDDMHKVIRAKHAYEWDKLLPQIGGKIAKSLKLNPTEEMSNYIADWCMTGAVGNSSSEAKAFETAMRNDPVTAGLMLQIREAFQEFNDMTAEQKIGSTIVSRLQGKSPREIARTLWSDKEEEISDDLHPVLRQINDMIAKAEKTSPTLAKLMKEDINPYQMMRLLRGIGGLGDLMIGTEKTNDIEDVRNQFRAIYPRLKFDRLNSLDMIVDMAGGKKHVDGLMKYAVAKLDKEMHEKLREDPDADIRPQFSEAVDDEVIKNGEAQYAKAHRSLVTYSNILLCIQHDAGLIGDKAFSKAIKGWKNYIPMIRVFEEGEDFKFEDSLKHKTGSQRSTYNPMETLTQNTYDILSRAERNKAKQQLAFYARIGEFGDIIQEIETSNPGNNVITFREGGKIKYLKVFDPAVKRAVDNIYSPADTSWIMKFLRATMNIVRNMRTIGSVDFAIGNPFRDMQDAYIHNRHADANPLKALLDTFREGFKGFGFKRILREKSLVPHDTDWAEFNALGGTQSTFVSEDVDQLRRSMNKLTRKTFMESFKEAPLHTVLDRMQWLSEQTEYMTRLNSYKRAKAELAKQRPDGKATLADKRLAALEARDASIDFAKAGTSTRKINQLLMFANAQVQDWAKWGVIGRDFAKGGEARKIATQKIGRMVLNGVVTTLLFAALNRSDDDRKEKYKKRPDWEKETYWIFGDGVRIPKGQDIATRFVSALTDEFIDKAIDDDPVSGKRIFKIIRDAVPSIIPSLIEPAYEVRMNYSAFRDAPIVPVGQQRLDKAEQYGKYTSSFAKLFSEMTGLTSPRGVDYLINGYLGSTGRFVTQAPDYLFKRGMTLNDVLMVRRFAFDPAENTKTVKDYYEAYDEQYKHYNTYKLRRKWDKNAKPHEDFDPKLYSRLKAAQEPLQHISKMENDILRNPKLDWDTKNKKIRELEKKREKICERVFKRAR